MADKAPDEVETPDDFKDALENNLKALHSF